MLRVRAPVLMPSRQVFSFARPACDVSVAPRGPEHTSPAESSMLHGFSKQARLRFRPPGLRIHRQRQYQLVLSKISGSGASHTGLCTFRHLEGHGICMQSQIQSQEWMARVVHGKGSKATVRTYRPFSLPNMVDIDANPRAICLGRRARARGCGRDWTLSPRMASTLRASS